MTLILDLDILKTYQRIKSDVFTSRLLKVRTQRRQTDTQTDATDNMTMHAAYTGDKIVNFQSVA